MRHVMKVAGSSEVFVDDRGPQRVLRLSWHPEHRMAVLSLWGGNECLSTFRLPAADVPAFVQALTSGLVELSAAAETAVARRDEMVHTLLTESGQDEQPPARRTDTLTRGLGRAMDTVIRGCTRLRDKLDRR